MSEWLKQVRRGQSALEGVGAGLRNLKCSLDDVGMTALGVRLREFDVTLQWASALISDAIASKVDADVKAAESGSATVWRAEMAGAEVASRRSCERHGDCDAADAEAKAALGRPADHCHDDDCEDCHGR